MRELIHRSVQKFVKILWIKGVSCAQKKIVHGIHLLDMPRLFGFKCRKTLHDSSSVFASAENHLL